MKHIYLFIVTGFLLTGCGKEFLDIKREAHQVVPKELIDYQGLLDRMNIMLETHLYLNMLGADEYTTEDKFIQSVPVSHQWIERAYSWQQDIFMDNESVFDWDRNYQRILYANLALEVAKTNASQAEKDEVIGQALFHRAWSYYHLVTTFCDVYRLGGNENKLGLPLRTEYDITARYKRSSLEETYKFIEEDLLKAEKLINNKSITVYRPDISAVRALLAKLYLEMEDYEKALKYALIYLEINNKLFDYNRISHIDSRYTFSDYFYGENNPEILFYSSNRTLPVMTNAHYDMSGTILPLYEENDLRKKLYFYKEIDGRITFKGSYHGSAVYFTGIVTDEMYLLVAECYARMDDKANTAKYLNELLINRYENGKYEPLVFTDWSEEQIIRKIILERQKELCWRGTRWVDLKRYNKEKRFETTLKRTMLGQEYILKPNDPRWVWPIPPNEIIHSDLEQNIR